MAKKTRITIDEYYCKGCGLCIDACPKGSLAFAERLNEQGYHPVECTDQEACTGCSLCYVACPDSAITIEKE
ncbi:MAG: 4Fe-4S binding protein [Deltaproteobacteria bacterium]|nr:4Fe-4S binding protein [Deltaproteobacteria bacterium]